MDEVGEETEDTGDPKKEGEHTGLFLQEDLPLWHLSFLGKLVLTELDKQVISLLGCETRLEVSVGLLLKVRLFPHVVFL